MITLIIGTNRPNSRTHIVAKAIEQILAKKEVSYQVVDLEQLPAAFVHTQMYDADAQHPELRKIQDERMLPADRYLFVLPEYNGTFPGILKVFIDALSVREYKKTFTGKKAALVGVATGRQGNMRGLDHLVGSLNHMGTIVMPNKLPLSKVQTFITDGVLTDEATLSVLEGQVDQLMAF